jgi:hypothetical protein
LPRIVLPATKAPRYFSSLETLILMKTKFWFVYWFNAKICFHKYPSLLGRKIPRKLWYVSRHISESIKNKYEKLIWKMKYLNQSNRLCLYFSFFFIFLSVPLLERMNPRGVVLKKNFFKLENSKCKGVGGGRGEGWCGDTQLWPWVNI